MNNYDLNKLGNYITNSNMEYILYLFIQYCKKIGYDYTSIAEYILKTDITDEKVLINSNPEFKEWLISLSEARGSLINYIDDLGINMEDDNTIELYKGSIDSISPVGKEVVSPYASTIEQQSSILFNYRNNICKVGNNFVKKIEDGKTYIVNNPYSITQLNYILNTLAGTDNKVLLCFWVHRNDKDYKKNLSQIGKILEIFRNSEKKESIKIEHNSNDESEFYSFEIPTKVLKRVYSTADLCTQREMNFIACNYNDKKFNEIEYIDNNKKEYIEKINYININIDKDKYKNYDLKRYYEECSEKKELEYEHKGKRR